MIVALIPFYVFVVFAGVMGWRNYHAVNHPEEAQNRELAKMPGFVTHPIDEGKWWEQKEDPRER